MKIICRDLYAYDTSTESCMNRATDFIVKSNNTQTSTLKDCSPELLWLVSDFSCTQFPFSCAVSESILIDTQMVILIQLSLLSSFLFLFNFVCNNSINNLKDNSISPPTIDFLTGCPFMHPSLRSFPNSRHKRISWKHYIAWLTRDFKRDYGQ